MDITNLILRDHHDQRQMFSYLDDIDRADTAALDAVWSRLAVLLDVHAAAEERYFYPRLLEIGTGGGGEDSAAAETTDVIKDHNEIRDAVRKVADHETGTDDWWSAVVAAREANSDHIGEEERQDLADFRHHASLQERHDIAVAFVTYESLHAAGIDATDKDSKAYVAEHR